MKELTIVIALVGCAIAFGLLSIGVYLDRLVKILKDKTPLKKEYERGFNDHAEFVSKLQQMEKDI